MSRTSFTSSTQVDNPVRANAHSQPNSMARLDTPQKKSTIRQDGKVSHGSKQMVAQISEVLANLKYEGKGGKHVLPQWCMFFTELGIQLAQTPLSGTRTVLALAVPTRNYASLFIAFGAVLATSGQSEASEEYIQFIASQPLGTPVVYLRGTRRFKGRIKQFYRKDNRPFVTIMTGNKETFSLPLREYATKITVAKHDFKLSDYQTGGKIAEPTDFVSACLDNAASFISETQVGCLLIGRLSYLRGEATESVFGVERGASYFTGCLQDIIRARQFLGANHPYRCQVLAGANELTNDELAAIEVPPLTIFDGATAFLRHRTNWSKSHQIVVLDRTERAFPDAVADINQSYTGRVEGKQPNHALVVPDGIDAILFQEPAN